MTPEKFFRRKIILTFDPPPGTDEVRRELLDDIIAALADLGPTPDEREPTWRELLRTHRGRRWPLAQDLTRALLAVRQARLEAAPLASSPTRSRPTEHDDGRRPLGQWPAEERVWGAAAFRLVLAHARAAFSPDPERRSWAAALADKCKGLTGREIGLLALRLDLAR